MKHKIVWQNHNDSILFTLDSHLLIFSKWKKSLDMSSTILLAMLQEFLDNGLATLSTDQFSITTQPEAIYSLLAHEEGDLYQKLLKLPEYTPLKMLLEPIGSHVISSPDFKLSYRHFQNIAPHPIQSVRLVQDGLFWKQNDKIVAFIRKDEYQILNDIKRFNNRGDCSTSELYRQYGKILNTVKKSTSISMDRTLNGHTVYIPEKIELDLTQKGNTLELKANIAPPGEDQILFQPLFDRGFDAQSNSQEVYTIPPSKGSTERIHIPFTEKQREQLHKIKHFNYEIKNGKDMGDVLSHPEKYFDLEEIELSSSFSERVIGLGVYQPLTRSFSSKIANEWFPGIEIVDPVEGTKDVVFKTQEEVQEFSELIDKSVREENKTVPYMGYKIPIEEAQEFLGKAQEQFRNQKEPVSMEKKVLLIKENLNELEYTEETRLIDVNHTLRPVPNLVSPYQLKDYQKEGVAWLQELYHNKEPGCLLADDMGLGKTLQVLSFLEWSTETPESQFQKVLICAPKSLLENWTNEYKKFFPEGNYITLILGPEEKQYTQQIAFHAETWQSHTLVITNYETLRFNQIAMAKVKWDIVVLDEAQNIKTPGTLVTNAAKALNTRFKIGITGTPVENSFQDLWCLIDFCLPGHLGSRKVFNKIYCDKKSDDEELKSMGDQIREQIGPYLKRRNKDILGKELPQKYISNIEHHAPQFFVDCSSLVQHMPQRQKEVYDEVRESMREAENRKQTVAMISKLKKISDHPEFTTDSSHFLIDFENKKFWQDFSKHSARLNGILPAIDKINKSKEKGLIFAEYRFTQYILKMILQDRYNIHDIKIINGSTSVTSTPRNEETRQGIVDEFNQSKGFNILILSPIAAGTGLTITGANHVIHYSRHWNPAKENQATDRAYRIGQSKDVYVYYPMAVSTEYKTFDFILNDLLNRKNQLADSALFPSSRSKVTEAEMMKACQEN